MENVKISQHRVSHSKWCMRREKKEIISKSEEEGKSYKKLEGKNIQIKLKFKIKWSHLVNA
jgi:hypothetical protein